MGFFESLGPGVFLAFALVSTGFCWRVGGLLAEYIYWGWRRD